MNAGALKKLAETPGRHRIDDGLYLLVRKGAKPSWVHRYVAVGGKRRDMTLGSFKALSLSDARLQVAECVRERGARRDPIEVRKQQQRAAVAESSSAVTLRQYATEYRELLRRSWKNDKHAEQWLNSLGHLGDLLDARLAEITSKQLLDVLEKLNVHHHETTIRIRQRLDAVYERALIAGIVKVNPAAALKRALKAPAKKAHHASMPYAEVPAFMRRLRDSDASQSVRLGYEFLILSAARTNEVINATWSQIDAERKIWTVGGDQMKAGENHQVPITDRMREILKAIEMQRGKDWDWIFPSPQGRQSPMSNGAFLVLNRRMGLAGEATPHGMRSSYSTWAYETTEFRGEIIEASLAHSESDAVKAAYNRATYWKPRVELAQAWSAFCMSEPK